MPLDIVIFGVIAVILIFRFLGVLGQNDKDDGRPRRDAFGNHKKYIEEKKARREEENARREEERRKEKTKARGEEPVHLQKQQGARQETRSTVADSTVTLSDQAFLEGAKAAFALTLEAYAACDLERLKALLDKEMLARMKDEIEKRQKAEERLEISLLEIVDTRIAGRQQDERFEQIAVTFTSKQCHLLFDKDNKLIEGDPDEEELLCDLWTFRQALASQDPTWFLCATRSQSVPKAASKKPVARKKASAKKSTASKSKS